MNKIESIYRYPVKGLSGERLDSIILSAGEVLPGDREYAFARAGVAFDPDSPEYLQKTNFLALVRDDKLAEFDTRLDPVSKRLSILQKGALLLEADLANIADCEKAAEFFRDHLEISSGNQPRVVRATGGTKGHSFSDVPDKAVSLISLSSIREFGEKIGSDVDPARFRGNINFENDTPWQEFDWLDQDLRIGDVVLHVYKRTQRCAATTVNPETAARDINVPRELHMNYAHMDMGIYTEVIEGGEIKPGDTIEVI
jgi:uncharacterized protein